MPVRDPVSDKDVEGMEFSLEREEIPLKLKTKGGQTRTLILRELDGTQRDAYLTFVGNKIKQDSSGKAVGLKEFDRLQSALLARAIFDPDTKDYVPEAEIRSWRASVIQKLFVQCQKMNGLDDQAEEVAKND